MSENETYVYDEKFMDNILVLGQAGCGKTIFLQNLARNRMFGKLKSVDWISKITLTKTREEQMPSCFQDTKVNFSSPNDFNEFDVLIENFQRKIENDDNDDNVNTEILGGRKT